MASMLGKFQKKTISAKIIEKLNEKNKMKFSEIKKSMNNINDGLLGRELKNLLEERVIIKTDKEYCLNYDHPEMNDLLLWLNITPKDRKLHHVARFGVPGYQNKDIDVVVSTDKAIKKEDLDSVFKNPDVEKTLSNFYGDLVRILFLKKLEHRLKDVNDEEERERIADAFLNEEVMYDKPYNLEIHIIPTTKRN